MTGESDNGRPSQLDLYLDDRLSGADRATFESRLESDAALSDAVMRQHAIDAALSRRMAPPPVEPVMGRLREAFEQAPVSQSASRPAAISGGRSRRWALAAALLLAVGASGWGAWRYAFPGAEEQESLTVKYWPSVAALYWHEVAGGFKPGWDCHKDRQYFCDTFKARFGQGLGLAEVPAGVQLLGLSNRNCLTPRTLVHLSRVDGREVMVFIDRADAAGRPSVSGADGLHLFSREIGPLALYELTPLSAPTVLNLFCPVGEPTRPPPPRSSPNCSDR